MDWQPIETAPKDGCVVLLADACNVYPGGWSVGPDAYGTCMWGILDHDGDTNGWRYDAPTHWMPLPPPPSN